MRTVLCSIFLAAFAAATLSAAPPAVGDTAPDFTLRALGGNDVKLSVKAGQALRMTDFESGDSETRLAALFGFDFDWKIADRLTFTQDSNMVAETGSQATVIVDSTRTTLNLITGLDAKVSDRLSSRVTYTVDYDSKPPVGRDTTDTVTRLTLVYGF